MALDRATAATRPSRDAAPRAIRLSPPERRALLAAHDTLAIALPLTLLLHAAGAPLPLPLAAWLLAALPALVATEQYALARRRDRALAFSTAAGFTAAALAALAVRAPLATHLALLAALGATGLALPAGRRALESRLLSTRLRRRLLVVGTPADALAVHDALKRHPLAGDRPIGLVLTHGALPCPFPLLVLGASPQLDDVARRWSCGEAVAGFTALTRPSSGVRETPAIAYCAALTGRVPVRLVDARWLAEHGRPGPDRWARGRDVVLSAILMVAALPAMGAIGLMTPLTVESHLGRGGRVIRLWSFRTTDVEGRETRLGAMLHRTGLNRLPHLWSVLLGDLALVGPSPHPVEMASELSGYVPHYLQRLAVRPGLTGWAQVHAPFESPMRSPEAMLGYDLYYLQRCGWGMDVKVLVRTPWVMLARVFAPRRS